MNRKIIKLYFDRSGRPVTAAGLELDPGDLPRLYAGEQLLIHCVMLRLGESDGAITVAPRPLDSGLALRLAASENRSGLVMFISDEVNLPGDWDDLVDADPAAGEISFRVRTDTEEFNRATQLDGTRDFTLRLLAYPGGDPGALPGILGQCEFIPVATPDFTAGSPESVTPEHLDYAAVTALGRTAEQMQFSFDGSGGWHFEQEANDRFWRTARGDAAWSAARRIPSGSGFRIDNFGLLANRTNAFMPACVYYATDTGMYYIYSKSTWSDGIPASTGGNSCVDRQIAAGPLLWDGRLGRVHRLEEAHPALEWFHRVENMTAIEIRVHAPDAAGDIALIPEIDGVELAAWIVPVAAGAAIVRSPVFAPALSGRVRLIRDCASASDTLSAPAVITSLGAVF